MTVQLYGIELAEVERVNRRNVTERFLSLLDERVPSGSRIYLHNLEFDLPVLFYPFLKAFTESSFTLASRDGRFKATLLAGKINHAVVSLDGKSWELIDTFAFFKSSLARLAETFKLPPKLPKPRGLGRRRYDGKEWSAFRRYALRDAETAFALGMEIERFHERYDIPATLSAPKMSATIFKRKYLEKGRELPANPRDLDEASVLSYHGGKNGLYTEPGIYRRVYVYDINSAYPFAMTQIPSFLGAEYRWVKNPLRQGFNRILKRGQLAVGIYCISGESLPKMYNPLRDHEFRSVVGTFDRIWVTSYELATLRRHGFVSGMVCDEGYTLVPHEKENPLASFARHFYDLKSREKGGLREFYKIVLNSLYGKFIQNVLEDVPENIADMVGRELKGDERVFQAGGLWNPFLATLITGYVRAYLTELEIEYGSLHSSTDSVMTVRPIPTSQELGALSLKTKGTALLLRPKLYLVWDAKREISAYALHGFHGGLAQFVRMMRKGSRVYPHFRMTKVKESFRTKGMRPLTMARFFKRINLDVSGPLAIPKLRDGNRWL
jgi:hypothetical protein